MMVLPAAFNKTKHDKARLTVAVVIKT